MTTLLEKIEESKHLATKLQRSIAVRNHYGLSYQGTVTVHKVKPSGVLMRERHKHIVRIYLNDDLVATDSLPAYEKAIGA